MKKIMMNVALCVLGFNSFAQNTASLASGSGVKVAGPSDIKMLADYGATNDETTDILKFQNVDFYRAKFTGIGLKGKYMVLVCKEMWNGKVKKTDTLMNTKSVKQLKPLDRDTLALAVLGDRVDDQLRLLFKFPQFGLNKKFKALKTDDYSLRSLGNHYKIEPNKYFPAFAYILPYEEGDWKMYCAVDQSGFDVAEWGKKFKIKHYLIFEMMFYD